MSQDKKPSSARFVVFRTLESLIFATPIGVAFFYELPAFLLTVVICGTIYGIWTRYFRTRLSQGDSEAYKAVYSENDKIKVFQLSDLNPPWTLWLAWIAVVIYGIALM